MNIDGHTVRSESIDAVTEIEIAVSGVHEGTGEIRMPVSVMEARGHFEILIHGQKISIRRTKRFAYDPSGDKDTPKKETVKLVRDTLTAIRDPIVGVMDRRPL